VWTGDCGVSSVPLSSRQSEANPVERPIGLAVELTSLCNQGCRYCFNAFEHLRRQALPTEELLGLLERARSEVTLERVTLAGGEPFAYEGLYRTLEYCSERGLPTCLISNATMITREAARLVATFGSLSSVQITLNGPDADIHDAEVGLPGAWGKTLRGIDELQKHGVCIVGCIVLTRRTASLVGATLDRFQSLGIRAVSVSRFLSAGVSAHNLDLIPARKDLLEALTQADLRASAGMAVDVGGPIPPCLVEHERFPNIAVSGCPIGTSSQNFALGTDGHLRNCFAFGPSLGDVRSHSFAELVRIPRASYRRRAPKFCRGCTELGRCLGGCGAAALAITGRPNSLDPIVLQHVNAGFAARVREARERTPLDVPVSTHVVGP